MQNWSRNKKPPLNDERLIFRIEDLFFWIPQRILITIDYKTAHIRLSLTSIKMAIDYYFIYCFLFSFKI